MTAAAQWPSEDNCNNNIFKAMVDTCSTTATASNLESVNIAQWPSFSDLTQTGLPVEGGYPNYIIAPAQPLVPAAYPVRDCPPRLPYKIYLPIARLYRNLISSL